LDVWHGVSSICHPASTFFGTDKSSKEGADLFLKKNSNCTIPDFSASCFANFWRFNFCQSSHKANVETTIGRKVVAYDINRYVFLYKQENPILWNYIWKSLPVDKSRTVETNQIDPFNIK
jgi:hypothetical protein